MAGEIIGKIYEAILQVVLWRLKAKCLFVGDVFWNLIPEGITVEPDFLLGSDKDHPSHFFFVTHCGSSKNSDMKTWRNIGELCEAKSVLSPTPLAINVAFETVWKADLKKLLEGAFDSQLLVDERPYGSDLVAWVHANVGSIPGTQEEKAEKIKELATTDSKLKSLLKKLETDVESCLKKENRDLVALWSLEKARRKGRAPAPKETSVRRGLSKLMVFEDLDLGIRFYSGEKLPVSCIPSYAFSAGLAKKSIGKALPVDAEIRAAVKMLSKSQVKKVCECALKAEAFQGMLKQVRDVESLSFMGSYVKSEFQSLLDPAVLAKRIKLLHDDPNALVDQYSTPDCWPPVDVWLVSYLVELIKRAYNQSNAFGMAQMAQEVVQAGFGSAADLTDAGQFAGGFGYPGWLHRKDSPFRGDLVDGVAHVISNHLKQFGEKAIARLIDTHAIESSFVHNLIEAKICTYRMFEPLFALARSALPKLSKVSYRTCFAEKAGLGGAAGKTTVAQYKDVIVNWQSAYGGHSNDKRKELCGRAVGLRYTWDAAAKKFKPRPGVKKLVLLLDGTWTQKDLNALVAAGWDEIYYPDEIDKLKASVLGTGKKGGVLPKLVREDDGEMQEAAETEVVRTAKRRRIPPHKS